MGMRNMGRYEQVTAAGEEASAFIPIPLPPSDPPLIIDGRIKDRLRLAEQALARLNLAGEMVPSLDWFIYAFVRKEAVLSSQIEGTQATLVDLLIFEAEERVVPNADIEEVCNYLDALTYARDQISSEQGLPLSIRLLDGTHRRLMSGTRGAAKQPGAIRRSQNWIGGSRPGNAVFVPPPPHVLPELLSALEKYLHEDNPLPGLG
jgi:Fic family protein